MGQARLLESVSAKHLERACVCLFKISRVQMIWAITVHPLLIVRNYVFHRPNYFPLVVKYDALTIPKYRGFMPVMRYYY